MKKPNTYVITGLNEVGEATPVLASVTCESASGSFMQYMAIEAVHGYARNQREEGFVVTVEWMYEVPRQLQTWWAQYFLTLEGK